MSAALRPDEAQSVSPVGQSLINHMTAFGTKLPLRDVRHLVATGGVTMTVHSIESVRTGKPLTSVLSPNRMEVCTEIELSAQ